MVSEPQSSTSIKRCGTPVSVISSTSRRQHLAAQVVQLTAATAGASVMGCNVINGNSTGGK